VFALGNGNCNSDRSVLTQEKKQTAGAGITRYHQSYFLQELMRFYQPSANLLFKCVLAAAFNRFFTDFV
jgi:hypothetical protein